MKSFDDVEFMIQCLGCLVQNIGGVGSKAYKIGTAIILHRVELTTYFYNRPKTLSWDKLHEIIKNEMAK